MRLLPATHILSLPVLVLPLGLAILVSCQPTSREAPELSQQEDRRLEGGGVVDYVVTELPDSAFSRIRETKPAMKPQAEPPAKIHPLLLEWLAERSPNETERIVINFQDDYQIPHFPRPDTDYPLSSLENQRVLKHAKELITEIKEHRRRNYARLYPELSRLYNARVSLQDTLWLINAVVVDLPLGLVSSVADRSDVVYVEPDRTPIPPPMVPDGNTDNDIEDGRESIGSNPYTASSVGWIGLLDTGLRFTHDLLNPSHIRHRGDCINGGQDCRTGTGLNPNDDCWDHGTGSAAILTGDTSWGPPFRGVTAWTLDSWKVYPTSFDGNGNCNGESVATAVARGFWEASVEALDQVIVAQLQGSGSSTDTYSASADNAFDAGAVVIAPNGNYPGDATVRTPALAHKVIAVGAFDVESGNQYANQSKGPAPDGRIKPDIQVPTNTETASRAADDAFVRMPSTSGAAPYAGGAAALLIDEFGLVEPGQVYAFLILSGQQPFPFDNVSGAGRLSLPLPDPTSIWWDAVSVNQGESIEISLLTTQGIAPVGVGLEAAIWWPEGASFHNDIDLVLLNPAGNLSSVSTSVPSVFERARLAYDDPTCAPATGFGMISGQVIDTATGAPVGGAEVTIAEFGVNLNTDAAGCYTFAGIGFGTYTVAVTKTGYPRASTVVRLSPTNPSVTVNIGIPPPAGSTWRIRIQGSDVEDEPQSVYWAARVVPLPSPSQSMALSPINGATVPQNDPAIGCPSHPTRGHGWRLFLDWTDAQAENGIAAYELFVARNSVENPNPLVNVFVTESEFTRTSCNGFVRDVNVGNWVWRVRAQDTQGVLGAWSEIGVFNLEPCRLEGGSACSAQ
jgi:hypothetical protein